MPKCSTPTRHRLKREVGTSGRLMQTARVGRLEAGRHCFACAAFNVAGCSSPVSVTVDPAVAWKQMVETVEKLVTKSLSDFFSHMQTCAEAGTLMLMHE